MCKGTIHGGGYLIKRENFHGSIKHLYTKDIAVDECIGEEVEYLLVNGVATHGHSCCGHTREQSQVWLFPEYVQKAIELGYEIATVYDMDGNKYPVALLKTGTQSNILQYEGYMHGDENGMLDGKLPPSLKYKPYLGWNI